MIEDLKQAIEERVYIRFMYNGKFRDVEPYTLGKVDATGNILLNGFQIHGGTNQPDGKIEWKSFNIANIESLSISMDSFLTIRDSYNPLNDKLDETYACITGIVEN